MFFLAWQRDEVWHAGAMNFMKKTGEVQLPTSYICLCWLH